MIYLDSCVVIYLVEKTSMFHMPVRTLIDLAADETFAISHLTKAEATVLPLRTGDRDKLKLFERLFSNLAELPLPGDVFELAASIRAETGLKMPDALHVACARHHGCTELWTHDSRLSGAAPGLARNILAQL